MTYFVKNLKPNGDETMMYSMLDGVKNIGSQNTELLKKHKSAILTFQKGITNANIKDMCQALIDAIEGRRYERQYKCTLYIDVCYMYACLKFRFTNTLVISTPLSTYSILKYVFH